MSQTARENYAPVLGRSPGEFDEPWQKALRLWLNWNTTYDQVTARMFQPGHDRQQTEDLMDRLDELRRRAVDLSEHVIRQ